MIGTNTLPNLAEAATAENRAGCGCCSARDLLFAGLVCRKLVAMMHRTSYKHSAATMMQETLGRSKIRARADGATPRETLRQQGQMGTRLVGVTRPPRVCI